MKGRAGLWRGNSFSAGAGEKGEGAFYTLPFSLFLPSQQKRDDLLFGPAVQPCAAGANKDPLKVCQPQRPPAPLAKLPQVGAAFADDGPFGGLAEILAAVFAGNSALIHRVDQFCG